MELCARRTLIERLFIVITVLIRDTCKGISALSLYRNFSQCVCVCVISHTPLISYLLSALFIIIKTNTFTICQARISFL